MTEPYARPARKIVAWEEPPSSARSGGQPSIYTPIAEELRAKPGEWARLDDRFNTASAYQFCLAVRHGKPTPFAPAGSFEAKNADATPFVRYVGEPEESTTLDLTGHRSEFASPAEVRAWAQRSGLAVSERGAIPQRIVEAFEANDPRLAFS